MQAEMAALQPLVVGAVLIWAARVKLVGRGAALNVRRSALQPLLGDRFALPAYRLLGAAELVVGLLLLLPPVLGSAGRPVLGVGAVLATVLSAGFLGYLVYARIKVPESSCGCMSTRRAPVSVRSLVRAVGLIVASAAAIPAATGWWHAVGSHPLAGVVTVLVEAALVVVLSPEFDGAWLLPLRRVRVRMSHPLAHQPFEIPLTSTVEQMERSLAYRRVASLLVSDVREHWDEGDWRMVCYTARYGERTDTTAVFAVPRLRYAPEEVRVAFVDEVSGEVLISVDSHGEPVGAADAGHPVQESTLSS